MTPQFGHASDRQHVPAKSLLKIQVRLFEILVRLVKRLRGVDRIALIRIRGGWTSGSVGVRQAVTNLSTAAGVGGITKLTLVTGIGAPAESREPPRLPDDTR